MSNNCTHSSAGDVVDADGMKWRQCNDCGYVWDESDEYRVSVGELDGLHKAAEDILVILGDKLRQGQKLLQIHAYVTGILVGKQLRERAAKSAVGDGVEGQKGTCGNPAHDGLHKKDEWCINWWRPLPNPKEKL